MEITHSNPNIYESIEGYVDGNHNVDKVPKVLRDLQNRMWALKLSGCQIVSYRSVVNFFRRKFHKKKSAKKRGYNHFYTDEERRLIYEAKNLHFNLTSNIVFNY